MSTAAVLGSLILVNDAVKLYKGVQRYSECFWFFPDILNRGLKKLRLFYLKRIENIPLNEIERYFYMKNLPFMWIVYISTL